MHPNSNPPDKRWTGTAALDWFWGRWQEHVLTDFKIVTRTETVRLLTQHVRVHVDMCVSAFDFPNFFAANSKIWRVPVSSIPFFETFELQNNELNWAKKPIVTWFCDLTPCASVLKQISRLRIIAAEIFLTVAFVGFASIRCTKALRW